MKCRYCGREVNNDTVYCPGCGVQLKNGPDMDEITVEIAGKVDLFMNEKKNDISDDDVKMVDGQMVAGDPDEAGHTITRRYLEEEDSVFADISKEPVQESPAENKKVSEVLPPDEPERGDKEDEKPARKGLIAGIITAAVLAAAVAAGLLFFFGVFGGSSKEEETEETEAEEDVITCSVEEGGEYTSPLEITITSEQGNRLYYTLDGSTPSVTSQVYSDTISLGDSYVKSSEGTEITLKVSSYTDNSMKTGELEVTFTLVYSDVEAPVISPASGNFTSETYITISAESGAKIYYTTDGTTPTEESNLYTGQFEMSRGNTVISAIAVKNGIASSVTTAVYNLDIESNYTFSQAKDIVLTFLVNRGTVEDEDGNTSDGGYVEFMDGGTCIIDNDQYIVVICTFYDEEGLETDEIYYGVDDQSGSYTKLTKTDSGYTK